MKNSSHTADAAVLKQVGGRLERLRLAQNLTQAQLAEQAGLGLSTVQRLESGVAATQLSGFIRVCRVLGLLEGFVTLIPEPAVSPVAQLKLQGHTRKRASGRKQKSGKSGKWSWVEPS
jgi:transcriptional regulator with XRE-family HTH domain